MLVTRIDSGEPCVIGVALEGCLRRHIQIVPLMLVFKRMRNLPAGRRGGAQHEQQQREDPGE